MDGLEREERNDRWIMGAEERGEWEEHPKKQKHTAEGIRWSSPTQLLIFQSTAYVWQSGRDAQFSGVCGRMWKECQYNRSYSTYERFRTGTAIHNENVEPTS